jgi:uncharacterized protein YkwD
VRYFTVVYSFRCPVFGHWEIGLTSNDGKDYTLGNSGTGDKYTAIGQTLRAGNAVKVTDGIYSASGMVFGDAAIERVDNSLAPALTLDASKFERDVFDLTNAERAKHGLPPFIWDDRLAAAARAHSADMASRGFFAHINPDGLDPFDRMKKAGISYRIAAENIAYGQRTAQAVVTSWMNSPGHRANILHGTLTHLGVGFQGIFWTQKFITP